MDLPGAHPLVGLVHGGLASLGDRWHCQWSEDGARWLGYRDVLKRVQRNVQHGVVADDLLVVDYESSSWIAEVFAAWLVGAAVAPSTLQPDEWPWAAQAWAAQDPDAVSPLWRSRGRHRRRVGGRRPALVMPTSGTTGSPKLVLLTMEGILAGALMTALHQAGEGGHSASSFASPESNAALLRPYIMEPGSVTFLGTLPNGTVAGLNILVRATILRQSSVTVTSGKPSHLFEAISSAESTCILGLGPLSARQAVRYVSERPSALPDRRPLMAVLGGGHVTADVMADLEARLGCPVIQGYGCTELGGPVSVGRLTDAEGLRWATVGSTLPGVELCEGDIAAQSTIERVSTLQVRSPSMMWGVLGMSSSDILDGDEWVDTGDVVDVAEIGCDRGLVFQYRAADDVVRMGVRVNVAELEQGLRDCDPSIAEAVVMGVPSKVHGETDVVAVVETGTLDSFTLRRRFIELNASRVQALPVPQRFICVSRPLPRTDDGGVARHALRAQLTAESRPGPRSGVQSLMSK